MKPRDLILSASLLLPACNPYQRFVGEYSAGPVDPVAFPAAYLGDGGDPKFAGGTFKPLVAWVGGQSVGYYLFPPSSAQAAAADPTAVAGLPAPLAYVFDPPATGAQATRPTCVAPRGYVYDQQRDAVHGDEQGQLFTALPTTRYIPVVSEVPVQTHDLPCQSIKSTDGVVTSKNVSVATKRPANAGPDTKPVGIPDGKYLAWAIIDPSATVDPIDPATGLGPQSYGWYQHYLVVYLDGGYLPTNGDGSAWVTQTLYVPSVIMGTDGAGNPAPVPNSDPGSGLDVLDARRGDARYSPFCRISMYDPAVPGMPVTSADQLGTTTPTHRYVYCLQTS